LGVTGQKGTSPMNPAAPRPLRPGEFPILARLAQSWGRRPIPQPAGNRLVASLVSRPVAFGRAGTVTIVIALGTAGVAALHAQAPPAKLARSDISARYTDAVAFSRALIEGVMQASGTPGMSIAVGVDGALVWAEGFGYADLEARVPVTEETEFRIGSVSKPLTAEAVGLLVQQGRLDLDAPVQRYVPSFPEKRWPITTRQVAGHLSGIRHYRDDEVLSAVRYETVLDGLAIFQDDTLLFQPGERFSYSSYGWNLISAVVEGASGEDFLTYMQEHVFDPLGMRHTHPDHTDSIIPMRTRYYERRDDGGIINAPYVDNSYKWAGGGFLSTPSDLVRFAFAQFDHTLLRPETLDLLWTTQRTNAGEPTGYGIGWFVAVQDGKVVAAYHGGGSIGGTTGFVTRPQDRAAIAVVGNMTQAPTGGLLTSLVLQAFQAPDDLVASESGPDLSGSYSCELARNGEVFITGAMELYGSPEAYEGRIAWSNHTVDRVIWALSAPDTTRLVTVDAGANLLSLHIAPVGADSPAGTWTVSSSGPIGCTRH
jgi:serine beta-lactamase-like protein LACTB